MESEEQPPRNAVVVGQLKEDETLEVNSAPPPSAAVPAPSTGDEDDEQQQHDDIIDKSNDTDVGILELKRKSSRHPWADELMDAGKKIAKTTCSIFFGKREENNKSEEEPNSNTEEQKKHGADEEEKKHGADAMATSANHTHIAAVVHLTGKKKGDDDVDTSVEKRDDFIDEMGGGEHKSSPQHDHSISYSAHTSEAPVNNEGSDSMNHQSVENEQACTVVNLTLDGSRSDDDDDDSNNDIVEMFSMFRGNHSSVCSICKDGGDLLCCSFCERGFHFQCHTPPVSSVPSSQWKCSECSTAYNLSRTSLPETRRKKKKKGYLFRYNLRERPNNNQDASLPSSAESEDERSDVDWDNAGSGYTTVAKAASPRKDKCGECTACLREQCRTCKFCKDMKKFGGKSILKQACIEKRCPNKRRALSAATVTPGSIYRKKERETVLRGGDAELAECSSISTIQEAVLQGNDAASTECASTSIIQAATQTTVDGQDDESYKGSSSTDEESNANNDDECYMCSIGGELVCCDFCEKSYHRQCHIPRLKKVPAGKWKCCECSAVETPELSICGECDDCLRPNCGECGPCLDKEILGMPNVNVCELNKGCQFMRYAASEEVVQVADKPAKLNRNGVARKARRPNKASQSKTKCTKRPKKKKKKQKQTRAKRGCQMNNYNIVQSPFQSHTPSEDTHESGLKVLSIKLGSKKKKPNCFEEFFRDRTYEVKVNINEASPGKSFWHDGRHLELVAGKLPREKTGRFNVKEMKLMYIATEGPNLPKINLQKQLDTTCSFSSIAHVKVGARLSHLQSEAQHICFTLASRIEFMEENGNEGCGFFPRGFFDGSGPRRSYDSIQVRIIGPNIGLAKGMLLVKDGINKIQLPKKSMIKAPPSETCDENWVAIVIKNVFPCQRNVQLGRYLDPTLDACASWKKDKQKELSEMHQRMLIGYGVRKEDVYAYAKLSRYPGNLRHAHLKGVADPTLKIPEDKVFITGYTTNNSNRRELFANSFQQIYVSRSPAVSPEDAKILSVVGEKTDDMSDDDWDLLCSYRFGTIIFGAPRNKLSAPLPCMIADGDLDGDDYFVCWDPHMLSQLLHSKDKLASKSRQLLLELTMPDKTGQGSVDKTTLFARGGEDWLSAAQDLMLDFSRQSKESHITGKLYSLCMAASKKAGGEIDIYGEDACAYAQAYKDALDIQKHGGVIVLPKHLHGSIPPSLRALLAVVK